MMRMIEMMLRQIIIITIRAVKAPAAAAVLIGYFTV